jgi:hypothetical protein
MVSCVSTSKRIRGRDVEIAGISAAAFAFGDIAWNRHRSAPQLTSQAVDFLSRKATSAGVDVYHEFYGLLPNLDVPIRTAHVDPPDDGYACSRSGEVSFVTDEQTQGLKVVLPTTED